MITQAHISDQHFDRNSRWEEWLRIADWIVGDLSERKPTVITLGGDIFERASQPTERNACADWLVKLATVAEVIAVYGNHEKAGDLDIFNQLESQYPITFYDRPTVHYAGGAAIACLPWPRKSAMLAALGDVGPEQAGEAALQALRNVLLGLGVKLREHDGPKIFLGHVMVRGSKVSSGQPIIGSDFELGLDDLGLVGADAYALGHIHCGPGNEWAWNSAPIFYPGSPRRTSYGELEEKGYVWVEYEQARDAAPAMSGDVLTERDGAPYWTAKWSRIPTPCTPMLLIEADWNEEGNILDPKSDGYETALKCKGAEVRLRYRVPADQRDAAKERAAFVREALLKSGAIDVRVEEVVIPQSRVRAPEIATVKSLGEKIQILWNVRGTEPDTIRGERLLSMLTDIEQEVHIEN